MDKRAYMTVFVSLLTLGFMASMSHAQMEQTETSDWWRSDVDDSWRLDMSDWQHLAKSSVTLFDSIDFLGAPVKDKNGDVFGVVSDLKIDSSGKAIAIINHGDYENYGDSGRFTPVPFDALRISDESGKMTVALNMDERQFEASPFFDPTRSNDPSYLTDVYRFYGIQPSWTEQAACPDWNNPTFGQSMIDE